MHAVGVGGNDFIVFRWVVFDRRGAVGVGSPLAEVDTVGTPFEDATAGELAVFFEGAHEAAAFFKVETVEHGFVEWTPSRGAEIHVPVDLFDRWGIFGREPAAHFGGHAGGVGVDFAKFAQPSGAGQFAGEGEVGQVAPLGADLEDAAGAAHHIGQLQALGDVFGARFFAIHVFAGAGGVDCGGGVPVGTGGDQHCVDVVAGEQIAEVAIHVAIGVAVVFIGDFFDGLASFFFDVADGDELNIGLWQEATQVVGAPIADADAAHDDSFARGNRSIFAEG